MDNVDEVLQHYGVKGMKWGVRKRIQTARTNRTEKKASRERERSWEQQYRRRGSMSNKDLQAKVNRLRLENEFAKLAGQASLASSSRARDRIKIYREIGVDKAAGSVIKEVTAAVAKRAARASVSMGDSVNEILQHHGVKGMKWGVRKYKQERREGTKAIKAIGKADRKLAKAITKGQRKPTADNLVKQMELWSNSSAARKRANAAIERAANLPITIKRRDKLANAKRSIKLYANLSIGRIPQIPGSRKDAFDSMVDNRQKELRNK